MRLIIHRSLGVFFQGSPPCHAYWLVEQESTGAENTTQNAIGDAMMAESRKVMDVVLNVVVGL